MGNYEKNFESALSLVRHLPPDRIESNLSDLIKLCPHLSDDLLSTIEQPLKVALDTQTSREYIICDYNRDLNSYRSPWSNEYDPILENAFKPSPKMRLLEIEANDVFEKYCYFYYKSGLSSCYLWNTDENNDNNFSGAILFKNIIDENNETKYCLDLINLVQVNQIESEMYNYKLTSTLILWINNKSNSTEFNMSGNLMKQKEQTMSINMSSHLINIGKMIEDLEKHLCDSLKDVYLNKTITVFNSLFNNDNKSIDENTRKASLINNELLTRFKYSLKVKN